MKQGDAGHWASAMIARLLQVKGKFALRNKNRFGMSLFITRFSWFLGSFGVTVTCRGSKLHPLTHLFLLLSSPLLGVFRLDQPAFFTDTRSD